MQSKERKPADAPATQPDKPLTKAVEWPIAQLGEELSLPRLSAGGSVELAVGFDPETGALIQLSVKRQSADISGQLSKLTESAGGLVDAIQADADKNYELLDLHEKQAILEARAAIKAAEEALAQEPPADNEAPTE